MDAVAFEAKINPEGEDRGTPLQAALEAGNFKIAQALIKAGANVNAKDGEGKTPLMIAAFHGGNCDIIEALLNAGAKINEKEV